MKKAILFFTVFTVNFIAAQNVSVDWARNMGGVQNEDAKSVAVDSDGNVYTTGTFKGTVDFDPGVGQYTLSSAGYSDVYLSKLDSSGNFVWVKQMNITNSGSGQAIVIDANDNIYFTGQFTGTGDFDPGAGTLFFTSQPNYADIFLSKFNSSGSLIWAEQIGRTSSSGGWGNVAYSIDLDGQGNVLIAGTLGATADFDPGTGVFTLTPFGSSDIFVSKFTSNGNFIWAKKIGGSSYSFGKSMTVDGFGNIFLTGNFQGTADFDPSGAVFSLASNGYEDVFILKMDSNGNFVWAKQLGSTQEDEGNSIKAFGNSVYITGHFMGAVDFDPGAGTYILNSIIGSRDAFVMKLDQTGNFMWAKSIGGKDADYGNSVTIDATGAVIVGGNFYGDSVDVDPGPGTTNLNTYGGSDIFITKFTPSGSQDWVKQIGGPGTDYIYSIETDALANIYTAGFFSDTVDFDPSPGVQNLSTNGFEDIFVQKIIQNLDVTTSISANVLNENDLMIFPNPTNGAFIITIKDKVQQLEIIDVLGKKILTLNAPTIEREIDVSDYSNGSYIVSVKTENGITKRKLIVHR